MTVATNERDPQKLAVAIQQLEQGRSNAAGSCILDAGETTTVVAAPNCAVTSHPLLFPASASAAAELAAGEIFTTAGNGSFTITHANASDTDRTFHFVCLG